MERGLHPLLPVWNCPGLDTHPRREGEGREAPKKGCGGEGPEALTPFLSLGLELQP